MFDFFSSIGNFISVIVTWVVNTFESIIGLITLVFHFVPEIISYLAFMPITLSVFASLMLSITVLRFLMKLGAPE